MDSTSAQPQVNLSLLRSNSFEISGSEIFKIIFCEGMNSSTGFFTVVEPGVYQLSFTGFFVALRGHMVSFF
jgi:hypothetical protein